MTKVELRRKNDRLRDKIDQILLQRPELRDVIEVIAFRQDMHVQVGTPFLERVQGSRPRMPMAGQLRWHGVSAPQRPARSGLPSCNRFAVNPSLTLLPHRRSNDFSWDEWQ